MIKRSTWIVLAIFLVLLAVALLLPRLQKGREAEQTPTATATPESLFDVTDLVVLEINITGPDNQSLVLRRETAADEWKVVGFPPEDTDVFAAGSVAGQIFALRIQRRLENVPPLSQMGLIMPPYMITLKQEDGRLLVLKIGDRTPTGSGYYVQLGSADPVVVSKVDLDSILSSLENPPLLPTPTPQATSTPDLTLTPQPAVVETAAPAEVPTPTPTASPR